jgi:hypothetical protein
MFCIMRRFLLLIAFSLAANLGRAAEYGEPPIEGGKSPDGRIEVVNIHDGNGGYFEIRTGSGATLFSEKSLRKEFGGRAEFAENVLWRKDSRLVAIAFGTYKFAVETVVFLCEGDKLTRVSIPQYHPSNAEIDTIHCVPHHWNKSGDLVLDVTGGYHTKSDGGITGFFATLKFEGEPLKGIQRSKSKPTDRE